MSDEDGIEITADSATIMASEKVSTGNYENHTVSTTLEVSIDGADVTDAVPLELKDRLHDIRRDLQDQVSQAAYDRKREAERGEL